MEEDIQKSEISQNDQSHLLQFDDVDLTESKLTDKFKEYNDTWERFANELHPKMKDWWNMYRTQNITIEGVATKIPEIFTLVETQLPHLLNSIFSRSDIVEAKAKFQDPDGQRTYKIKSYINNLMSDTCKGRAKTELIIKEMLIYGWSVSKMYWNTDPDHDIDPITKEAISINSAHPDFYKVDPFAFAYDPGFDGQEIDQIDWVRERVFIGKNELKEMRDNGEVGDFTDDELVSGDGKDKGKEVRKNTPEKSRNKTFYDEFWAKIYYKVPIMESQPMLHPETGETLYDEIGNPMTEDVEVGKKNVSDEFVCWFLANKKIIKFQKNELKFKPYAIARAYSNPNEFLGQGESEIIGSIANQLSYVNLQAGKMVKKVGQNLTFIDPSAGISPQNLKRIEQGVVFVNNLNGIKSEQSSDPQNISVLVKFKEYLNTELQRITGIGPTLQGENLGDITATQASIVNQNASNRLANKLTHLQEDFLVPIATNFFLMSKQFLQIPVEFFDNNNNLIQLQPEDFNGNYTWKSNGQITQSNKALQFQQNQALLQGFIQAAGASANPQVSAVPFTTDIPYFIMQHLAPYASISDIQNIIKITPQPMMPQGQLPPLGQVTGPAAAAPPIGPPQGQSAEPQGMSAAINNSASMPTPPTINTLGK